MATCGWSRIFERAGVAEGSRFKPCGSSRLLFHGSTAAGARLPLVCRRTKILLHGRDAFQKREVKGNRKASTSSHQERNLRWREPSLNASGRGECGHEATIGATKNKEGELMP